MLMRASFRGTLSWSSACVLFTSEASAEDYEGYSFSERWKSVMSARKILISYKYPIRYQLGRTEQSFVGDIRRKRVLADILPKVCCCSQLLCTAILKWCWGRTFVADSIKQNLGSLTAIPHIVLITTDSYKILDFHLTFQMMIRSELLSAGSHDLRWAPDQTQLIHFCSSILDTVPKKTPWPTLTTKCEISE